MIRVGVVGCGQWGVNHIRNLHSLSEVKIIRCADTQETALQRVQTLYPGIQLSQNPQEVASDPQIDAVVVATPTSDHFEITRSALEQGKDVLCEKPLTTSSNECEQLIDLAHKNKRILMVGHVFVFNPAVTKLQEQVAANRLGKLYYMSARRTNLGPIRSDVDVVWDLASHDLSIFDYLLAGLLPDHVSAYGGSFLNSQRADVAFITLAYPNQVVANIHTSWLDPQKRREVTVVGSDRMAIFNDVSLEAPLWIYDKGAKISVPAYETFEQFRVISWDRDATVPKVQNVEPLINETYHFLECIRERRAPQTDGHNALRIIRILEAISRSKAEGGTPVQVS